MTFNNKKSRAGIAPVQPCPPGLTNAFICPVWRECLEREDTDCATHGCLNAVMYKNMQEAIKRFEQRGDLS